MGKDGAKKQPKQVFKKQIRDKADHSSCFAFILDEKKANMIEVNMIVVPKSKKLWFYKIPDHNPLPFIKTPIDPGSSKSVAEIAVAANKHFGTLIACAFDAGLVTLINFANGKLLMKMSLHDQVLRALQPSFLVLSLPQDDAEPKTPYRILYGDGDSSNVCILEQKIAAEEITDTGLEWKCQTVAVVAALGEPITATIKDDHLVIIGNEGVKSRVWEMMRQLPPPSDFAPTAVMDKDLRTKKLQQYPYLLVRARFSFFASVVFLGLNPALLCVLFSVVGRSSSWGDWGSRSFTSRQHWPSERALAEVSCCNCLGA